jgi:hypothetical protein
MNRWWMDQWQSDISNRFCLCFSIACWHIMHFCWFYFVGHRPSFRFCVVNFGVPWSNQIDIKFVVIIMVQFINKQQSINRFIWGIFLASICCYNVKTPFMKMHIDSSFIGLNGKKISSLCSKQHSFIISVGCRAWDFIYVSNCNYFHLNVVTCSVVTYSVVKVWIRRKLY